MNGTILTPTAIWKNFIIEQKVKTKIVDKYKIGSIIKFALEIEGREVNDGKVNIYAEFYQKEEAKKSPVIILMQDFSIGENISLVKNLVKQGYGVMLVDLAGKMENKTNYTRYPISLDYVNYEIAKDNLFTVSFDAVKTCWYEWSAVIRYVVSYLNNLPNVTKIGCVAFGDVATVLWQVAGTDENLDCAVFGLNSGWLGYRGVQKFGGMVEPQFDDQMYKFIAGIDPQSYAMHVNCPVLMLSATNNVQYDIDRAFDTLSKIKQETYSAIHYSINQVNKINQDGYFDMLLFLSKYLQDDTKLNLPCDCDLKCEIENGQLIIEANGSLEGLKSVNVCIAEELADPTVRSWQIIKTKKVGESYVAKYTPFNKSELAIMYAVFKYANGFTICSKIIAKKFNQDEIAKTYKNNIVYSSRIDNASTLFVNNDTLQKDGDPFVNNAVLKKKGPMGIEGITSDSGVLTFMPSGKKCAPNSDSIFMLDVYSEKDGELVVCLIADYPSVKTEYFARVSIKGEDIWHNVQLPMNKFKTAEGMPLKDYSKIQAMSINVNGSEYLVNNALWI
ncbi:MAG: hypothetical protein E7348_02375 [Clostridiales bacterium]|nr:hypothetical protein [Clostridiales bacterium]